MARGASSGVALHRHLLTEKTIKLFWRKVIRGADEDCWLWTKAKNLQGYGSVTFTQTDGKLRSTLAHRLSFVITYGFVGAGVVVRHRCNNPPCVNPLHLAIGTHRENMLDYNAVHPSRVKANLARTMAVTCPPQEIAAILGEQPETIYDWIANRRFIDPEYEQIQWGQRLNTPLVRELRARYERGDRVSTLAREFGIGYVTVHDVVHYRTWKHVEQPAM